MTPDAGFLKKSRDFLCQLIRSNNAPLGLEERLEKLVCLIRRAFEVAFCGFFSIDRGKDLFILEAASNENQCMIRPRVLNLKDAVFHQSVQEKSPLIIANWQDDRQKAYLQKLTGDEPRSLLAIPVGGDHDTYGALVLVHDRPRAWSKEEVDILGIASLELAEAWRSADLLQASRSRIAELTALFEVEKVLGTTLDLGNLLRSLVFVISKVMNASGCGVFLIDHPNPGEVQRVARHGDIPDEYCNQAKSYICKQEVAGYLNTVTRGDDTKEDCGLISEAGVAKAILAPLGGAGKWMGTVCVYGKKGEDGKQSGGFTSEDMRLLSTIGGMIAKSLENVLIYADVQALARENEKMVRELSTVYQVSGKLMTTVSADEIVKIFVEAITGDEGAGFDRAVIFLVDEQEQVLREKGRRGGDRPREEVLIPLKESGGALARAVEQRTPLRIEESRPDPVVSKIWPQWPEYVEYGVVPVMAKDKVIGVIMVDNSCSKRAITEGSQRVLSMLAHHAGLALDNARLYAFLDKTNKELIEARELLAEAEKIAAMGEMASTLAHEIRNPLVSVGGLARRAIKVMNGDSAGTRYLEVIVDEVGRLERTLNELLDYAQEPEEVYVEKDLISLTEECLELMRREFKEGSVSVIKNLEEIPPIWCDARQIKHTLFNILLNARQAMPGGGTIWISSSLEKEDDHMYATCTIKDTGGGVPEDILHNIFNPFFTTKKQGSGLGLAVSYRIVSRHGGKIGVENEPGRGVAFVVKLPLNPERKLHRVIRAR